MSDERTVAAKAVDFVRLKVEEAGGAPPDRELYVFMGIVPGTWSIVDGWTGLELERCDEPDERSMTERALHWEAVLGYDGPRAMDGPWPRDAVMPVGVTTRGMFDDAGKFVGTEEFDYEHGVLRELWYGPAGPDGITFDAFCRMSKQKEEFLAGNDGVSVWLAAEYTLTQTRMGTAAECRRVRAEIRP